MDLDKAYYDWKVATGELQWGVQKAFKSVLEAAQDGKTTLVYGADYSGSGACLVNTVGVMLTTGGGQGVPMANYAKVVSLFDEINRELQIQGVNTEMRTVSPLAAEILLQNFAPVKPAPTIEQAVTATISTPTRSDLASPMELSDREFADELERLFTTDPILDPVTVDISEPAPTE